MDIQEMLDRMKTANTSLFIHSTKYSDGYSCEVEYTDKNEHEGFKFKSQKHMKLFDAVDEVFWKWAAVTQHSFKDAVPALLGAPAEEGEVIEIPEAAPVPSGEELPF